MDATVNVPVDDPNADTEWYLNSTILHNTRDPVNGQSRNDILRKHGVIPEKPPSPTPIIQEAILEARRQAHDNRLEDKDLDELDELEDEENDAFLTKYRSVQHRQGRYLYPFLTRLPTETSAWQNWPPSPPPALSSTCTLSKKPTTSAR